VPEVGAHEQVPESCVIELVWLPKPTKHQPSPKIYALPHQVRTARFELILSWTRSRAKGQNCRVDAVWPLDFQVALSLRERSDIRDVLDTALKERMPGVHVRAWDSTVIAENGPVNKAPIEDYLV